MVGPDISSGICIDVAMAEKGAAVCEKLCLVLRGGRYAVDVLRGCHRVVGSPRDSAVVCGTRLEREGSRTTEERSKKNPACITCCKSSRIKNTSHLD